MFKKALFLVVIVGFSLSSDSLHAQQYKPGDKVVVIHDADIKTEQGKVDSVWPGLVRNVLNVNGKWLWVNYHRTGWLDSKHVIPLNQRAVEYFTTKIKQNPKSSRYYHARSIVWEHLGELDIAMGDIEEAIRISPSAAYHNSRGNLRSMKNEHHEAIGDYTLAISLNPKEAVYHSNRAGSFWHLNDLDQARKDYNEAIRIDPGDVDAFFGRGSLMSKLGKSKKALKDYNRAIALDHKNSEVLNCKAWLLATCPDSSIRDGKQAVKDANLACKLTAWKKGYIIDTLAAAYAEIGDFENALKWQKKAVEVCDEKNKADYASRIALYESQKPYRQSPKTDSLVSND